jgi:pseudaminic acid biosynthesis-associated methylase
MVDQIDKWKSEFGNRYTERNEFDWKKRVYAFEEMLYKLSVGSILEVGCNRGYNLMAVNRALRDEVDLTGIEPNKYALELTSNIGPEIDFLEGDAYNIPFEDGHFDLTFTSGVLIHIPPEKIDKAISEIYRVSEEYILPIEYYSEKEEEIEYRGEKDMLWKRDFYHCYKNIFPSLSLVRKGYWGPEDGFDRCHWWLLKKT